MTTTLHEAGGYRQGTRAVIPEGNGQKIKVRLMGWEPGTKVVEGSSADYPVDRIVRDFPESFPQGTRMRANHDSFCEAGGDVRRIMAKTTSAPWEEADGMYAWARVKEGEATDFVRQFADVIGTSISVGAEIEMEAARDEDGEIIMDGDKPVMVPKRSERGAQIVSRFLPIMESPYNAVDFVEAPGADGAIVALATESAKQMFEHALLKEDVKFAIGLAGQSEPMTETSEATPPRDTKKENTMESEEAQRIAEAAATAAVAEYVASQAPSAPEQPTLGALAEAVVTAGLSEAGRAEVYARVDRGETLESAITAETTREASIQAEVDRRVAEALASKSEGVFDFGFTTDDQSGKSLPTPGGSTEAAGDIDAAFDLAEAEVG